MKIPLWISEDPQAGHGAENGKGKRKIKQPDYSLIADVITGRFSRIPRHESPVMADDDCRIGVGAGALE